MSLFNSCYSNKNNRYIIRVIQCLSTVNYSISFKYSNRFTYLIDFFNYSIFYQQLDLFNYSIFSYLDTSPCDGFPPLGGIAAARHPAMPCSNQRRGLCSEEVSLRRCTHQHHDAIRQVGNKMTHSLSK